MQMSHSLTRSRRTSLLIGSELDSAKIYRFRRSKRPPKFFGIKVLADAAKAVFFVANFIQHG